MCVIVSIFCRVFCPRLGPVEISWKWGESYTEMSIDHQRNVARKEQGVLQILLSLLQGVPDTLRRTTWLIDTLQGSQGCVSGFLCRVNPFSGICFRLFDLWWSFINSMVILVWRWIQRFDYIFSNKKHVQPEIAESFFSILSICQYIDL